MNDFLTYSELRRVMIQHKAGQTEMKPEYVPPEGQPGKGGPDPHTELKGFHQDYNNQIERILGHFPNGAHAHDIGAFLTEEARSQSSRSCGPYMRATMLELRDIVAPDYLKTVVGEKMEDLSNKDALGFLYENRKDASSRQVLGELEVVVREKKLGCYEGLQKIESDYTDAGDDWLSETANLLRRQLEKHKEKRVDEAVKSIKEAERAGVAKPHSSAPAPGRTA